MRFKKRRVVLVFGVNRIKLELLAICKFTHVWEIIINSIFYTFKMTDFVLRLKGAKKKVKQKIIKRSVHLRIQILKKEILSSNPSLKKRAPRP